MIKNIYEVPIKVGVGTHIAHVVEFNTGNFYYVSTNNALGGGWETMIFKSKDETGNNIDWNELFSMRYKDKLNAHSTHYNIVMNLDEDMLLNEAEVDISTSLGEWCLYGGI